MPITIKRMTVILVLIIGTAMLLSTVTQAQPKQMSVEEQVKILKGKLKLNDEQIKKITEILEDQREEMATAANDYRGDREVMHTVMLELWKKTDNQIIDVLTDDQVEKYEKLQREHRAQMRKRMRTQGK